MRVERVRPEQWPQWRAIRLEALADSQIAFMELLVDAQARTDVQWQEWAVAAAEGDAHGLWLARDGERVLGCIGGLRHQPDDDVLLYTVYVTPSARSAGVLDLLLHAVTDWARSLDGVTRLRLEVHEDNGRARAAYVRRGFAPTGATAPFPHDPSRLELEMDRPLSR